MVVGSSRLTLHSRHVILQVLLATIMVHPTVSIIHEHVCNILSIVALRDGNATRIAEAGGIDVLLQSMATWEDHAGVQFHACFALGNLAINHSVNQVRIGQAGIARVVTALQIHSNDGYGPCGRTVCVCVCVCVCMCVV
jgi:hypothetical protein